MRVKPSHGKYRGTHQMSFLVRSSINIILLNPNNEILLMCADDPKTTTMEGKYHGKFWFPIGGQIEKDETIEQAAYREIFEESGIKQDEVILGPVVWFGEFDLILAGTPSRLKQQFIVAKTKKTKISLSNLTTEEKEVVKKVEWFSLEEIKNCKDIVYPILLPKYLPDILAGKYPNKPIEIDLGKQPG